MNPADVLGFVVAQAAFAGDEYHRYGRDRGDIAGVVARPRHNLHGRVAAIVHRGLYRGDTVAVEADPGCLPDPARIALKFIASTGGGNGLLASGL